MPQKTSLEGIEWVSDTTPATTDTAPTDPKLPGAAKGLFAVLCVAVAVLGFVTLSSHERVEPPAPAPTPVPTPTLDLDSFSDPGVQTRFEATLSTLPDLTLVLAHFDGSPAVRVLTGSQPLVDAAAFQDLHSLTIDASGRWVAGLSGRADLGQAQLWVGPADESLEPLAMAVSGFAWHETNPSQLAFSSMGSILTTDVSLQADPEQAITSAHHLERWGTWGFVVRPQVNGTGFHVLSTDGQEVATGYQGSVVGSVNQRLIVNLAGGRRSPLFVFADTGQAWPVFALTDTDRARSIVTGGADDTIAMQVSNSETDTHEIRIFPGDGTPTFSLPVPEQTGAVTWSSDGTTLYYLSQGAGDVTELFGYDIDTGALMATPVGASSTLNYWDSAIAVG